MIFPDHPSPKRLQDHDNQVLATLFLTDLKSIYGTEKEMLDILGLFLRKEFSKDFGKTISFYASISNKHVENLETIFLLVDNPIKSIHGHILSAVSQEAKDISEDNDSSPAIIDLKIYKLLSHFNHYKIACYSQLVAVSDKMGLTDVNGLLRENLHSEQKMSEKIQTSESLLTF
ncbi:ferritin-like domain-containing protein [Litoribacter ruber]|uniref:Ferritin-like domain-containing protein n=1 Tax=Litoribacter ruber TaxID=702568 RepID=A0AAP2CFV7_9BACT|nr:MULTISPECIES: DUF892 family protein [Litoribacter]MBS9523015.1 ferritin-like domain-containing protein [Litoribacter alkaliphilus]MBT0810821.1 ferritin-like domain-containing protein [Litoribacter ruber]